MDAAKALDALKRQCKDGETEAQHARHAEKLERAYADFSDGSRSNPAPRGVSEITAEVVAQADNTTG